MSYLTSIYATKLRDPALGSEQRGQDTSLAQGSGMVPRVLPAHRNPDVARTQSG
jgi:hypothetical protein